MNQFIYKSLTLVCGGQENDVITWRFSENSDLSSDEALTATYSNTGTGLSWLNVENTKQGYYQCQISSSSYTVGVYDTSVTTGNANVCASTSNCIQYILANPNSLVPLRKNIVRIIEIALFSIDKKQH